MQNGSPIHTTVLPTLADGLAVPCVGYNAFATARPLVDKMIVVNEDWISLAILQLVELEKCVVEGAAACGLAAILSGQLNELKNKKFVYQFFRPSKSIIIYLSELFSYFVVEILTRIF